MDTSRLLNRESLTGNGSKRAAQRRQARVSAAAAAFAAAVWPFMSQSVADTSTVVKANNTSSLNNTAAWVGGALPGIADTAQWNSTVTAANTVSLGGNVSVGTLQITNPGGLVTISSGNTLTLDNASAIDLSAATQSLTINASVALGGSGITQTFNTGSQTLTISTVTDGTNTLVVSGSGNLVTTGTDTLNGLSTYSGTTTVGGATLTVSGAAGSIADTSAITVTAGGTLTDGDTSTSISNRLNSSAALTLGGASGGGTFGYNTSTASPASQTLVSLSIGQGASSITSNVTTGQVIFTDAGASGYTLAPGGLLNFGTGSVSFTNAPTAAGGSSVAGTGSGAILLGATLNGTDLVAAGSGTVAAAAYTTTTASANLGSGLNANLTGSFTAADGTVAQALRFGATNLTLTLAGTTTVQSGMIVIGTSGTDNITGGTLQAGSGQPISVFGPSGNNLIISSVIADNGGTAFERVGSNTVTLSGSNTFSGQIYDSSGNFDLNNVNALGAGTANINILTSSTIQSLISGISIARNWVVDSGATLTYNTNTFDTTLSGTIASSNGGNLGFLKSGNATLHFTGSTVSSPNATLDVQGGTLDVTGSYISSAGAFSWNGATGTVPVITIRSNGIIQESGDLNFASGTGSQLTLNVQDNGQLIVGARGFFGKGTNSVAVINQSGGLVSVNQLFIGAGNTSTTYNLTGGTLKNINSNGGDVDTGSVINFNGGTLTATSSNTFASTNSLSGATPGRALILPGGLTVDAPSGVNQTLLSPLLSGVTSPALDGGVTKVDSGTLTLSGANTYTGPTTVTSGTLAENLGPSSSSLTNAASNNINSSGNLVLGGNGTFSVTGRGNGAALMTSTSAAFVSGATQISLGSVTGLMGGQAISGTGLPANEFISSIDGSIVMLGLAATGTGTSGEGISTTATTGTTSSQAFNTTVVNSGASSLSLTNNATSVTLKLGTLQHNAGGVLNLATALSSSIILDTSSSNDASGIVGAWFTIGSGTSLQYGTISSGQIIGYTGQTTATANFANVTSEMTNYSYTGSATLGGNRTANTLTQGATGTTIGLNGNSLTLNGIMLNGATSTMIISGNGSVVIGANQELVITQDGTSGLTISSSIVDNSAGPSSITYSGGNQLTLSGANSYSGGTTLDAGTFHIGGASGTPLGSTSATVTVNGGVLDLNGTNLTVGNLAGSFIGNAGSIADNSSTAASLTVGNGNATGGNYSGAISSGTGVVSLIKTGTGLETLSGTNTAIGTIAINAGTLQFAKEVSLYNDATANWTASKISVASGATLGLNVGGIGQFTAADVATLAALGNGSGGGFQSGSSIGLDTTSGSYSYTAAIANPNGGANALGVTKLGTNTLTLSAASTYTGGTTVAGGTLALSTALANNIANSKAIAVGTGATLDVTGVTAAGGFALSGTGTQSSSQSLGGAGTVKGNVTVATGASISAGTGTFAGTGANTTGALTLNTGTTTFGTGGNYIWKVNNATGTQGSASGWDSLGISSLALNPTTASPFTVQLQTVDGNGNLDGVAANFSNNTNYQWIIATIPAASVTTTTAGLTLPTAGNSTTLATSGSSGAFVLDTSNFNLNQPPTASSGEFFQLSLVNVSGTDELVVGYNATPEPASAILLLAGATPMLLTRRRRQRPMGI